VARLVPCVARGYLHEENRILREKLGHKRIILNEPQKRRLATAAMKLGKDLLRQFGTQFSPSTLLKWHRYLVARKYDLPRPLRQARTHTHQGQHDP
jgi:deoxyinosine 3'endonuclease (endonuclease V)